MFDSSRMHTSIMFHMRGKKYACAEVENGGSPEESERNRLEM